jgi:hypothetical protein
VIFDEDLLWSAHTKKVVSACNYDLYSLKPFSFVISSINKSILANALVLSHNKYGSVVWMKSSSSNYKAVDNIIRSARFVFGLMKFDSVSDIICSRLNWFFSKYQYKLNCLKLAYKVYCNICPLYFRDYLCTNIIETTRTRHRVYQIPALKIGSVGRNSFKYTVLKNSLIYRGREIYFYVSGSLRTVYHCHRIM